MNTSAELITFCRAAAGPGLEIFQALVRSEGKGYRIEIELEGTGSPPGRVSLADCEEVSQRFIELLDQSLGQGPVAFLPVDLDQGNYSLEISSAGAERELRLPEELERFRGQPLKIRFQKDGRTETELVVFKMATDDSYVFDEFLKKSQRTRKKPPQELRFRPEELLRANLYLEM